jgi:hypothetical protein
MVVTDISGAEWTLLGLVGVFVVIIGASVS